VRSSRRLEREARRNTEVIWLLRGLTPGYRTIANFRRDNAAGLRAANRELVVLARRLDLLGGELVAIDGAFFHGDASKASILTKKRLEERMAALDRSIAEYHGALTANDRAEEAAAVASPESAARPARRQTAGWLIIALLRVHHRVSRYGAVLLRVRHSSSEYRSWGPIAHNATS
jgi:hypothetical protein